MCKFQISDQKYSEMIRHFEHNSSPLTNHFGTDLIPSNVLYLPNNKDHNDAQYKRTKSNQIKSKSSIIHRSIMLPFMQGRNNIDQREQKTTIMWVNIWFNYNEMSYHASVTLNEMRRHPPSSEQLQSTHFIYLWIWCDKVN